MITNQRGGWVTKKPRGGWTTKNPRGGFVLGIVVGLLVGLALALGVALYITKAPVPFVNKVPQRTAEMDNAEAERNRNWDPNAPLAGKAGAKVAAAAAAAASAAATAALTPMAPPPADAASAPGKPPAKDPAAILAGKPVPPPAAAAPAPAPPTGGKTALDPFVYFVQAGAYSRVEEADQQRARLGLIGQNAKITEREQAGRVVYRVRLGPFPSRDEADALQARLQEQTIEAQIVRVEKP